MVFDTQSRVENDPIREQRLVMFRSPRLRFITPNSQFPRSNHFQLPTPNVDVVGELGIGNWEWLVVGS